MRASWTNLGLWSLFWDEIEIPGSENGSAGESPPPRHAPSLSKNATALQRKLDRYFQSHHEDRHRVLFGGIDIDPSGWSSFAARVYTACREIARGETETYSQLAQRAGHPGASRAVGAVMAGNRVLLVIPCHRVVAANGKLHGFSAPGGLKTKKYLLDLEHTEQDQMLF